MLSAMSPDGTPIAYSKSGYGPALLLVHGTTANHSRWGPLLPELNELFSTYTMDRRGRGESGDAPPYAIEREFEDIATVVDAIGEPAFLLGHSFGAVCSLEAALRTDNVEKLILYEPPLQMPLPSDVVPTLEALLRAGKSEEVLVTFLTDVARIPMSDIEVMRSLPAWPLRVGAARTIPREVTFDDHYSFSPGRFASMTTPTLLLLGGESAPPYVEATERVHAALRSSRVVRLPGQRHSAMDTDPELFIRSVCNFLLDDEQTGSRLD